MFNLDRSRSLLCLALFLGCASAAWSQPISVQLDGRGLRFDQPPAMVGGRLLVPLRGIFEALEADVVYDAPTRSIQATKGSRVVQLQLGSRTAIIDGRTMYLDVPADTIGGRTMVPLRFVSEALGADVKWEGATKTVLLSSGQGDGGPAAPPPAADQDGPSIDRIIHNGTRPLSPGDVLNVVLYGEPGGEASFEILGKTSNIPLPEVGSGRYETRWTIPQGLQVEGGVLVASLRKSGRETALEAERSVTVTGTIVSPPSTGWNLLPAEGSVVPSLRPQVAVTFPVDVRPETVRFFVDGVDFSSQTRLNGRHLSWQPGYNLTVSQHRAEVQALSRTGERLTQSWLFRIDPNQDTGLLQIRELRPQEGSSVGSRPQIGALFNANVSSPNLWLDGRLVTNDPGVQRLSNGILWTPSSNLATGEHVARVQVVDAQGKVFTQEWTFQVGSTSISNFTVSPTTASAGQHVRVRLNGPRGATGTFSVGQSQNLSLRETSPGVYEGIYSVTERDRGSQVVAAELRLQNGQLIRATAPNRVDFATQAPLTVTNLSEGMTIDPVFNVQGQAPAGSTVTVVVEYNANNILGALIGQTRTIRTQAVANSSGFYNAQVDASALAPGQQMRLTVSAPQQQSIQLHLTRRG